MVKSKSAEQKILIAARKVFEQKGLWGARMQEIADEAGINKALLHYYFRSKDKLFEKIFQDSLKAISVGFIDVLKGELPILEKLKKFIEVYINVISKNPYLPMFVLNEMNQNPNRLRDILEQMDIFNGVMGFFMELMKEMNAGNIRAIHPSHLLLNIMGMIVFPFAVRTTIAPVLKEKTGIDYDDILAERKQVVFDFVCDYLKTDRNEEE